jgi:dihydroneopterin aldolase
MLANPLALAARITVHKPRAARDAKAQDVCITVTRAR